MKWNRLNPGVPEKGERSSLFRVLARTPFNSCVRACCLFLPPCPAASAAPVAARSYRLAA